jgi:formylglycine-generating enzyme required for sulfatase activity
MRCALALIAATLYVVAFSTPAQAQNNKPAQSDKERLVLMPLRVSEEDKNLQGAMEAALVKGLQQKYEVFSGEQVAQKAHEIFMKESKTAHKECDETRCMQGIAEAFQAELIATANVTKQAGGYFLALSIQNIFDNKVVYSESLPCKGCDSFQVVDKLKILSGVIVSNAEPDEAQLESARKQKAEQLKKEQHAFEEKLRNADAAERKRLLDAKAADDKRLAELKAAAEARRKNGQAQPTGFPPLEQAQPEIDKLKEKIASIEAGYEKELADTRKQVTQRYAEKLDALKNEQKDEFESKDESNAKQDKKRRDLISQRDGELASLNVAIVAETETAPLKARIKALTEHEYILGAGGIEAELGTYDADAHQFPVKLTSKSSGLKLRLKGNIPLTGDEAKAFKQQWQAGLVKPEAKARLGGDIIELALVNDADNTRMTESSGAFYIPGGLKELTKTGRVFKDCPDCPDMVVVPAGSFDMGSSSGDESPAHRVTIGKPFAMGKTEVTQGQWKAIMGNNPSKFQNCRDTCPVEQVSWNDAKDFIQKLNAKTGKQYRLPSEAEWEYACRAGGKQEYCGSDNVDSVAWHDTNSGSTIHPAAQKQANAWGLYDMSGNVWEWVEDSNHADYNGAPVDGTAWQGDGAQRVLRGGSWLNEPQIARAALRLSFEPTARYDHVGFRLARTLP